MKVNILFALSNKCCFQIRSYSLPFPSVGLDITEHKEFAYHNLMLVGHELYDDLEEWTDDEQEPTRMLSPSL